MSSGNHAQGVAEAARLFGVGATIIMPTDAPETKRLRTERSSARVVTYDRGSEDRDAVAARFLAEHGGTLIHPFDNADVIAGQGTAGLEIAADCVAERLAPDAVLVPTSGGGLSAGIGLAVRERFPEAAMVLVEPEGFDDYGRSLAAGARVANQRSAGSVCDALLIGQPGVISFAVNRAHTATGVAVSDAEAMAAVAFAFRELKLVVEPGGAVALAAVLCGQGRGPRPHSGGGALRRQHRPAGAGRGARRERGLSKGGFLAGRRSGDRLFQPMNGRRAGRISVRPHVCRSRSRRLHPAG